VTTIKFAQWPEPVPSRRGTILESALGAGVPFPHDCRSGQCGTCKARLLAGEIECLPCDDGALSADERSRGVFLACRAVPRGSVEVAWIAGAGPQVPVRSVAARVVRVERVGRDICRFWVLPNGAPLEFLAGQYAQLALPGLPSRPYSMASHPGDTLLEFQVRRIPQGLVSGAIWERLAEGDTLELRGPFGSAHLREAHSGPLIALGGSTGLAPMLSIVRAAVPRPSHSPIRIYVGVRKEDDIYAEDELRALVARHIQVRLELVLSDPAGHTQRRTGFLHQALAEDYKELTGAKVYCAGPPPMVEAVAAVALELGVGPDDLHSDPFNATLAPPDAGAAPAQAHTRDRDASAGGGWARHWRHWRGG
jgi:naphthalene 1,2-dioxygenase ferredoxin reductase component